MCVDGYVQTGRCSRVSVQKRGSYPPMPHDTENTDHVRLRLLVGLAPHSVLRHLSRPLHQLLVRHVCVCMYVCSSWHPNTELNSLVLNINHNRADKYALFNLWRRPPALNGRLVTLSRSMLMFTIFVHVVMSRIFFGNW